MAATQVRAIIVSGKGGTGKTTVAASLAMAATRAGRSTLLLELEGRAGAAPLLGLPDRGGAEHETELGFSIASVGPREALIEYLNRFYGMTRLARPLLRSRAVDAATEVAPGFRDLMLAGKLYETAEWRRSSSRAAGSPRYDLVVADAPPTGQIVPFLQAPGAYAEMIRVGRPGRQARAIESFLERRALVILVTTLEELPVAETLEALRAVEDTVVAVGPVIANRVLGPALPRPMAPALAGLSADRLAELSEEAGRSLPARAAGAALEVVRHHRSEEAAQRLQRRRLRDLDVLELPALLTETFGRDEIRALSRELEGLVP